MPALLDALQLGDVLESYQQRLFRAEVLPRYAVESDRDDFHRWAAGETAPDPELRRMWGDVLTADHRAGKARQRVRVLSADLTDYERYSCQWGYAYNAEAGEDIRVLRHGEHDIPDALFDHDYWVVDDDQAVVMHYDQHGSFGGAEILHDRALDAYLDARDDAWDAAEPWAQWWARHPELHRRRTGSSLSA